MTPRKITQAIANSYGGKTITPEKLESMIEQYGDERAGRVVKDILDWLQSDDCYVTDKDGNKLPDAIIDGQLPKNLQLEK